MNKKKIGIITFDWATNYGAVLQAYALQSFLQKRGFFVEIIKYKPARVILIQYLVWLKKMKLQLFYKELLFKLFRSRYLIYSTKSFYTNHSLIEIGSDYDVYICGSDQIWNTYFLNNAEGKRKVLSYFLNFVSDTKKRIAYATSFGAVVLDKYDKSLLLKPLTMFSVIGVRENTAKDIISQLGLNSQVVLDPTCLLKGSDYIEMFNLKVNKQNNILTYVLHDHPLSNSIIEYHTLKYNKVEQVKSFYSIIKWLTSIFNSDYIITNSFHGTVFAILFHIPFIVILIEGSGMNDRLLTLLSNLNLLSRVVYDYDESNLDLLYHNRITINWKSIDIELNKLRDLSMDFLLNNIS